MTRAKNLEAARLRKNCGTLLHHPLALKMRATGLSPAVLTDFTVLTGERAIGRIYEVRGSLPNFTAWAPWRTCKARDEAGC
jgi:hypothetical protein